MSEFSCALAEHNHYSLLMIGSVKHQGRDTSVGSNVPKGASYEPGMVIAHHAVPGPKALIYILGARLYLSWTASFLQILKETRLSSSFIRRCGVDRYLVGSGLALIALSFRFIILALVGCYLL